MNKPPTTEPAIMPADTGFGQLLFAQEVAVGIPLDPFVIATEVVMAALPVPVCEKNDMDIETTLGLVSQPKALYPLWV